MRKTWRKRITAWGMMGLLVVGLNVWFAPPARAVPIDYTLAGGQAVGGFTIDTTLGAPYIEWNLGFTSVSLFWNNLTDDSPPFANFSSAPGEFNLESTTSGQRLDLVTTGFGLGSIPSYHLFFFNVNSTFCCTTDNGFLIKTSNAIPEPHPGALTLIGLLVIIAGARWWTHRQERLPLG